jgi:hypothetical protein
LRWLGVLGEPDAPGRLVGEGVEDHLFDAEAPESPPKWFMVLPDTDIITGMFLDQIHSDGY